MRVDLGIRARITAPVRPGGSPASVVAALSARKAIRSGVLWGYIFGIAIASSQISYTRIYKTPTQRDALAATYGTNKAMSALFGPAPQLQTVGGFTVFKISMTLMILGAVWGLLTSTRLLRGEEDSGRWDLLLTGQATRRGATAQAIAGLGAGVVVLWVVTAIITVLSGLTSSVKIPASSSLYFALAMVATSVIFLGVSYALRLVADAGVGLHGLTWASPLGWVEELQPLTSSQPLALLPIVAFTAVLVAVAVHLAGARDVGESIVHDRAHSVAHLGLLSGPTGLAIRLMRATVIGWWVAIAVSALLYGVIAKSAGATISGSLEEMFSKLGATGTGADAVLGLCFLIEAFLIAFVAAGQVTSARAEESGGRVDHFLTRPLSRPSWLGGRLLVALAVLVLSGVGAGIFAWLGAATQHTGLSFTTLLEAGVNLVPPAIVVLGIGVLAFGIRPRWTSIIVYGVLGWSLLLVIVGGIGAINHWVLDTSVFHHMASAPAVHPNWEANGIMTAVGLATALVGGLAFRRRDLQGE
jgi:ABC-2 type transport system permease protein